MIRSIERKAEMLEKEEKDRAKKTKEEAIQNIKNFCEKEELEMPNIQKIINECIEKINETSADKISPLEDKAIKLIEEERNRRKRLY